MKQLLWLVVFALFSLTTFAQSKSGFGLRAGLNYSSNGDYFESLTAVAENPDRNVGYHFGVYYKLGGKIFIKPELLYTKTKSEYPDGEFDLQKIDIPAMVGIEIFGPLNLFLGPDFQFILDSKFDGISINEIESDFTVGIQVGLGVSLGNIGLDIRYEKGLSENEAIFINDNITSLPLSRIDTRSDQIILALSVKI